MVVNAWLLRLGAFVSVLGFFACFGPESAGDFVPPTADEDPDLPQTTIEVAGQERAIHIESYGNSNDPTVLVLHGSLADFRALRLFADLAEDGFQVVLWDQRGQGLSERIPAAEIHEDYVVEEIEEIRRKYAGDRRVVLLGHSFGAMYASLYASRRPGNVDRLVLLEPAGLNGDIFTETFDQVFRLNLFDPDLARTFWQNEILGPGDHEQMDYKALMLLQSGGLLQYYCDPESPPEFPVWRPGAYFDLIRNQKLQPGKAGVFRFDYAEGLDRFDGEVLLLGSECSALGWKFQEKHHLPLFKHVRSVRIDDAGHRLMVEQPRSVLGEVLRFLSDLD